MGMGLNHPELTDKSKQKLLLEIFAISLGLTIEHEPFGVFGPDGRLSNGIFAEG